MNPIDVEAWRCDEMIDWSTHEPDFGPRDLPMAERALLEQLQPDQIANNGDERGTAENPSGIQHIGIGGQTEQSANNDNEQGTSKRHSGSQSNSIGAQARERTSGGDTVEDGDADAGREVDTDEVDTTGGRSSSQSIGIGDQAGQGAAGGGGVEDGNSADAGPDVEAGAAEQTTAKSQTANSL